MIVSEARIAANRRNALKSTGPKTAEGKEKSRANALKHGLCSSVVVPEDAKQVQTRAEDWYRALKPKDAFQGWLVDQVAVLSLRIDRAERIERRLRDKVSLRAELTWDDDRRLDAERLGAQLAQSPGAVSEALRRTAHGCEWLMARWAMLAHAADVKGAWTPDQARLAFDLLATPPEFREGMKPGASLDFDGRVIAPDDDPAAVARREIAALRERRELVGDFDEVDQTLASSDLSDNLDPDLTRLRRYEGTLHRRLRWCLAQLEKEPPDHRPNPGLKPRWVDEPQPAPQPEPTPAPAPTPARTKPLEAWEATPPHPPEESEARADRREKRLQKAEARREAQRRKLERLRA